MSMPSLPDTFSMAAWNSLWLADPLPSVSIFLSALSCRCVDKAALMEDSRLLAMLPTDSVVLMGKSFRWGVQGANQAGPMFQQKGGGQAGHQRVKNPAVWPIDRPRTRLT
ncbi:hypothetical protein Y695_02938 [Hydrogenophaga sp. T4]|nr:hypothetical protein Y695_02938 [Hydrogenophaga sp. T4]